MGIPPFPLPLWVDADGVVRVGNSQVLLDVVVRELKRGASAQEIARTYPALKAADAEIVAIFYRQNEREVDAYLEARREEARRLRAEVESDPSGKGALMAKLRAREHRSG